MTTEQALELLELLEELSAYMFWTQRLALVAVCLLVPLFADLFFRSARACWLDLKRRKAERLRRRRPTIRQHGHRHRNNTARRRVRRTL